jgi:hypothetical protein
MPTILLKTLAPLTETSDAFDYADQIKTLMRHPPVNIGGFTLDQVKMAASIIKEVDQAEDGAAHPGQGTVELSVRDGARRSMGAGGTSDR